MCLRWEERSFGLSVKQLLDFTLLEPGIVSDLVEGVGLYYLPVVEDCVQQILQQKTYNDTLDFTPVKIPHVKHHPLPSIPCFYLSGQK